MQHLRLQREQKQRRKQLQLMREEKQVRFGELRHGGSEEVVPPRLLGDEAPVDAVAAALAAFGAGAGNVAAFGSGNEASPAQRFVIAG